MDAVMRLTPHAVDRYREHRARANEEDAKWAIHYGEELDKNLVAALTQSPRRSTHEGKFVLSRGSEGWGIWVIEQNNVVRTYLRLGETQKSILRGDEVKLEDEAVYITNKLPEEAYEIRQLTASSIEFKLGEYLVFMTKQPARGPLVWVWTVKATQTSKGIASGWGDINLAMKQLKFTVKELQSARRG